MSIRLRLALIVAAVLGALALVEAGLELAGLSALLDRTLEYDLRDKAGQVQAYLDAPASRTGGPVPLTSAEALPPAFSHDGTFLQLSSPRGQVLFKSPNLGPGRLPPPTGRQATHVRLGGTASLMVTRPLHRAGRGQIGWIQVALPRTYGERVLREAVVFKGASWLIELLVAFAAGLFFAGRALAPVSRMTEEARAMDMRDMSRRLAVPEPAKDEIERLGATFNALFDRLETAFGRQKNFVADASHELRTPLTAIQGYLDLIRRRAVTHPDQVATWAGVALGEVERLKRLTNDLLELAKLGEPRQLGSARRVDLAALAREVASELALVSPRVAAEGPPGPVWTLGDADRLKQIVVNLADNALRATREGGVVRLSAQPLDGGVAIVVRDTGIGIPLEAVPHLFERFYRLEASRDRQHGGSGLGLPIVAAIAQVHGGSISVDSAPGRGTTMTVRLPAAP